MAYQSIKRLVDFVVSFIGLILLSPLFLIIAGLIKLQDGGPVFYVAERVGIRGKRFRFPKFRTMLLDADAKRSELKSRQIHSGNRTLKVKEDPRVTALGRFLRRTSIDELPQLWCVFKGDMSLVRPRPALPEEVDEYSSSERKRLDVLPGITCLWQVSGRSDLPFARQLELDLEYIHKRNLWLDLKILLKTIPAVISGKGAY
ncbi:MAG: sugar transferase [Chlamydiia bacterium]|nr:sugar transferase [Chlamydiia bacterium]